jgi:hypothetical protein
MTWSSHLSPDYESGIEREIVFVPVMEASTAIVIPATPVPAPQKLEKICLFMATEYSEYPDLAWTYRVSRRCRLLILEGRGLHGSGPRTTGDEVLI